MDVSVHSFFRMAKLAEPLMPSGGCLLAITYYGGQKAVEHYGVMGPIKGALETAIAYMALELGGQGIRVNAISPGPVATRSASGLKHFDQLLDRAARLSPEHRLITPDDVGALAAFLVSDGGERHDRQHFLRGRGLSRDGVIGRRTLLRPAREPHHVRRLALAGKIHRFDPLAAPRDAGAGGADSG